MKNKLLLVLAILFLGSSLAFGQQSWKRIGGWGNSFTGISWVSDEQGYIAGPQIILKTIDGGLSWVEQEPPTKTQMNGIDFFDENLGLIVGENGEIYRTTNGGQQWNLIQIATNARLKSVSFLSQNRVYAVGDNGDVYRSTNSGLTWVRQNIGLSVNLNHLYFHNQDTGYIAASNGQIARTFNGGNNWSLLSTDQTSAINGIHFISGMVGYAVGNRGLVLKTENAGLQWTRLNSGTERDLLTVSFSRLNTSSGVFLGRNATIIRTINGGLTLDGINVNNAEDYVDVKFRGNTNTVFGVGTNGFVISSINAGNSWTLRLSGRDVDYTGVKFRTDNLGYIIGKSGRFFVTSNGGNTLVDRSRPLSITFKDIDFPSNNFGYISGDAGTVLRTSNSGSNWSSLNLGSNRSINGLFFYANTIGYAVGDGGFIVRTVDSGVSWQKLSESNTTVDLVDYGGFGFLVGIVIGKGGYIGRSEELSDWERISVPTSEDLTAIKVMDDTTGIVVGNRGTILKTIDEGKTWRKINVPFTQNLTGIDFLDEQVGFISGERGLILRTRDSGETWDRMETGTFQNFTGISFGSLSKGYAVGEKGTFFDYACQVPATPTVIFGEDRICLSQQVYSIQETAGIDEEFDWRIDGGTIMEGQGTNRIVVRWDVPGRNAVLVRSKNECGNGATRGLEVVVSTTPQTIPDIMGDGAVCLNTTTAYELEDFPGSTYIWTVTGGLIREGQGTNRVIVEWNSLNQQTLTVTPENPCGRGQTFTKSIRVQQPPAQPSVISGPDITAFTEEVYEVQQVANVNFQWRVTSGGGRVVAGQGTNRATVRWEREGNFEVIVTPMNECEMGPERSFPVLVNLITSISPEINSGTPKVYPNPSPGLVNIDFNGLQDVRKITFVNALGQISREIVPREDVSMLRVEQLPTGLYTILIQTREQTYTRKLVVKQ
ncbi:YCF48-related protein [Mongoliitalea daihaiensis]|uniref:YCF48-related protein n=1 Tax=Mongoliitalea daihaiensis TaxID=2782006 RepID=UPI001F32E31F|nr:YCF48-related protein [Mongoliitalea daihaiensis]UJP65801.1 T9SS type A sorting domain-containing protein [Mongoliitalea daihaiensis]